LLFPDSHVYTLVWDVGSVAPEIEQRVAQTSFLQKLRGLGDYRNLLPLFPAAVRSLRISGADLVISSSHAVAKGARIPDGVPHLCYLHTPMRYLWDESGAYFAFGRRRRFRRLALEAIKPYLKRFDRQSIGSIDCMAANSENVRKRAWAAYGMRAKVVYPPVDVEYFRPDAAEQPEDFYLIVSALEPYKRIDLALEAFRGLPRRLIVVGSGSLAADLRHDAPANVSFTGQISDAELRGYYRRARAFILPGVEDFGMAAVEAQGCGRPVICYAEGGGLESVIDGVTGVHFASHTARALADAIGRIESSDWSLEAIRANAERFSAPVFRARIAELGSQLTGRRR
jgi:glycosyltransferase involved in cell wall biosynthesis